MLSIYMEGERHEKNYFGTDGIRGIAFEKLNSKLAFKLGQAIAKKFSPSEIIIGFKILDYLQTCLHMVLHMVQH